MKTYCNYPTCKEVKQYCEYRIAPECPNYTDQISKETEFPQPSMYHLDMDTDPPVKTKPAAYSFGGVNAWLKRCVGDFPKKEWGDGGGRGYEDRDIDEWYKKWFSQFIEKGDEDE